MHSAPAPADNADGTGPAGGDGPRLLAFGAAWSVPWRLLRPVLDDLAGDPLAECQVQPVDVDADPGLADRHRVVSVPTFVIVDPAGNETRRVTGAVSPGELTALATVGTAAKASRGGGMRSRRR